MFYACRRVFVESLRSTAMEEMEVVVGRLGELGGGYERPEGRGGGGEG